VIVPHGDTNVRFSEARASTTAPRQSSSAPRRAGPAGAGRPPRISSWGRPPGTEILPRPMRGRPDLLLVDLSGSDGRDLNARRSWIINNTPNVPSLKPEPRAFQQVGEHRPSARHRARRPRGLGPVQGAVYDQGRSRNFTWKGSRTSRSSSTPRPRLARGAWRAHRGPEPRRRDQGGTGFSHRSAACCSSSTSTKLLA
jgi:hypothetical protein